MKINDLFSSGNSIYRVLAVEDDRIQIIDWLSALRRKEILQALRTRANVNLTSYDSLTKRKLYCEISKYYEWIFDSLNSSLLLNKVVAIFAFVTQKIELRDIAKLCEEDEVAVGDCLYHLYPLLQEDVNGFYVFHNDVRLYFKDRCKQNRNCANIVQRFESIINTDSKRC